MSYSPDQQQNMSPEFTYKAGDIIEGRMRPLLSDTVADLYNEDLAKPVAETFNIFVKNPEEAADLQKHLDNGTVTREDMSMLGRLNSRLTNKDNPASPEEIREGIHQLSEAINRTDGQRFPEGIGTILLARLQAEATKKITEEPVNSGLPSPEDYILHNTPSKMPRAQAEAQQQTEAQQPKTEQSQWAHDFNEELRNIQEASFNVARAKLIRLKRAGAPQAYTSAQGIGSVDAVLETALTSRISDLQERAREDALLEDVDQKIMDVQKRFNTLVDDARAGKITSKDAGTKLGGFRNSVDATRLDSIGRDEPEDLKGIRQYTLDEAKNSLKQQIDTLQTTIKADEEARGIIPDFYEYLQGVERIDITTERGQEEQRQKVRAVLTVIENTRDSIKGTDAYKALQKYIELDYAKLNKGDLLPDIEEEVRASLRICETYYEIREAYVPTETIKDDMEKRIVPRLKAAGLLTTTVDFEKLFVEQYKGMPTQGVFLLLQEAGIQGISVTINGTTETVKFRAKMDPVVQTSFNQALIERIKTQYNVDEEVAERTLNIVKKGLLIKFEDMVWDEGASHPISEAVHFANHLKSRNPAFVEETGYEPDILTLGTSFDRSLRKIDKPNKSVFQSRLDEVVRTAEDPDEAYAALCLMWKGSNGAISKLDFNGVSYIDGVASNAYENYLASFLPAMMESKKAFFDASLGLIDRKTLGSSGKTLDTLRKVDPYQLRNLKARYLTWAIVRGSKDVTKDFDFSLTAGALRRLLDDKKITKDQMDDVVRNSKLRQVGATTKILQGIEGYQKRLLG